MVRSNFTLCDSSSPEDIFEASLSVSHFLEEICPAVVRGDGTTGLTRDGADGLRVILETQTNTIKMLRPLT